MPEDDDYRNHAAMDDAATTGEAEEQTGNGTQLKR